MFRLCTDGSRCDGELNIGPNRVIFYDAPVTHRATMASGQMGRGDVEHSRSRLTTSKIFGKSASSTMEADLAVGL
jgi:hypothetical protein